MKHRMSRAIDAVELKISIAYSNILKDGKSLDQIIDEQPTIEPQRKTGKWLPDNNNLYEMRFVCSECKTSEVVPTIGFTKYKPIWDYCPNCGAKMEEGEEN